MISKHPLLYPNDVMGRFLMGKAIKLKDRKVEIIAFF
jgi:hypothetical protein